MKAVQQPVRNTVVPIYGNRNKPGVDFLPAFKGEQYVFCFCAAVKYGKVIKLGRIFNFYLRMIFFQIIPERIKDAGISAFGHHDGLIIQIFDINAFFGSKMMFSGHRNHFFISAEFEKIAVAQPFLRIADADQKVKFLSQLFYFTEDSFMVILKGNEVQLIFGKIFIYVGPEIYKGFGRVQK